jgi:hypothetical protein
MDTGERDVIKIITSAVLSCHDVVLSGMAQDARPMAADSIRIIPKPAREPS